MTKKRNDEDGDDNKYNNEDESCEENEDENNGENDEHDYDADLLFPHSACAGTHHNVESC